MDDVLSNDDRGLRLIHGRPEVVESEINRLGDTYVVTGLYYHVIGDHLEVCAQLIHSREFRKAQLGALRNPPSGFRQ